MSNTDKTDILILGATGYTGKLITKYLANHPDRASFTLQIGARSKSKLEQLFNDLELSSDIEAIQVDVLNENDVERAVKGTRIVINTVGPYWKWGTPVVRQCARHGVHYVDLTGESPWIHSIQQYDYLASRNHAVIIPSCGFDSIPSDISAFLSVQTLKSARGPQTQVSSSTTAHAIKGGVSGGTFQTMATVLDEVPRELTRLVSTTYAGSPAIGTQIPRPKFLYTLPFHPHRVGGFFMMSPVNSALVRRSWGLFQARANKSPKEAYGPQFAYDEFIVTPNRLYAVGFSATFLFGAAMLMLFAPVRWLFKRIIPASGYGPSPEQLEKGRLTTTNVTSAVPQEGQPPLHAKTTIKGKGDPGYFLTAIMIAESALCLLPSSFDRLPDIAKEGGILTPMTALGNVLIEKLEKSGRFSFESELIEEEEDRKDR